MIGGELYNAEVEWDLSRISETARETSIFHIPVLDKDGRTMGGLSLQVFLSPHDGGKQSALTVNFYTIAVHGWANNEQVTVEVYDADDKLIRATAEKMAWNCHGPMQSFKQTTWDEPIADVTSNLGKVRVVMAGGTWHRCD